MANQIERDVYVTYEPLKNPISYVRGTNALPIVFHFRDYDIPEGAAANVVVVKPSGKGVYNPAAISGNDVTVTVDQQMFIELGTSELQVSFTQGDSELVTFSQPVWVKPNYKDGDFPPSESSSEFLDDILNGANEAVEKADAALANAETALQEATEASSTAQQAAATAQSASETANQAATTAQKAATDAQTALTNANQALQDADQAIQSVQESVQNMNTNFASLANTAEISTLTTENQTAAGAINELMAVKAPGITLTATGEQISVSDASGQKLRGLNVYGKGKQVKTTGAQLTPLKDLNQSGLVLKLTQKGLTINGTTEINDDYYFSGNDNPLTYEDILPGEYTISCDGDISGIIFFVVILLQNGSTSIKNISESSPNAKTFIINDGEKVRIFLRIVGPNTFNNRIITPMLNAGSSPLPWEPYTGGQPSPSVAYPQDVHLPGESGSMNVDVYGGNLLNPDLYNIGESNGVTYTKDQQGRIIANGTATSNSTLTLGEYVKLLKKGETYSFSGGSGMIVVTNGITTYIKKLEMTDGVTSVRPYIQNVSGTVVANKVYEPMLNKGETALPWEPPKPVQTLPITTPNGLPGIPVESGGNYTDQNGQQWISDVRDEDSGKYTQMVIPFNILPTDNISEYKSNGTNETYLGIIVQNDVSEKTPVSGAWSENPVILCNRYIGCPGVDIVWRFSKEGISYNNYTFNLNIKKSIAPDIESFKTWLQSNPINGIVILENPIVTDLPAEEMAAYNAMHSNYPNTNVFSDQEVEPGMEVEYVGDTQIYIDNKFQVLQDSISAMIADAQNQFITNANMASISQLGTTDKTLVGAINELNSK